MPFTLVTGTMGGGKTYYAVEQALQCFREGGIVHSNLDWAPGYLESQGFDKLHIPLSEDPQDWKDQLVGGAEGAENLLVVDESAMLFHMRDQSVKRGQNSALFDILVMSRKLGLDVYFITQAFENVATDVRRMASRELYCVAVKRIPVLGAALVKIYGDFMRRELSCPKRRLLTTTYARFDPAIGAAFVSEALRGQASAIRRNPTRQVNEQPGARLPSWVKWAAVFSIACVVLPWFVLPRIFDSPETPPPAAAPPQEQPATRVPAPPPAAAPPKIDRRKVAWFEWDEQDERVIGVVYRSPRGPVVYTRDGGRWEHDRPAEGGFVASMVGHAGRWFVRLDDGRNFVLRPLTHGEREELREQQRQLWNSPLATTSPHSAPVGSSATATTSPFLSSPQ